MEDESWCVHFFPLFSSLLSFPILMHFFYLWERKKKYQNGPLDKLLAFKRWRSSLGLRAKDVVIIPADWPARSLQSHTLLGV